jgi:hypothetical protein
VVGEPSLTALNPLPAKVSNEYIRLLDSIPKAPKPASGWPVVVFQHGITRNRTHRFAVVAMDLPLDGLTTNGADLHAIVRYTAGHHSSLLTPDGLGIADPATAAAVNRETQAEMAVFLTTDGASVQVGRSHRDRARIRRLRPGRGSI